VVVAQQHQNTTLPVFRKMSYEESANANSLPIIGRYPEVIGYAPKATRPSWLSFDGPGQKNIDPLFWTLTIEQWIWFVQACVNTETWKALATARGDEYKVSMYDVKDHFVVPWTKGTGNSIALLMNPNVEKPEPTALMLSHAWGGSVLETYNCLQSLCNHEGVLSTTSIFFCVFSMYQPEDSPDSALHGLLISEQLKLDPFAAIIKSKPRHGMYVLHTTTLEVYSRMWTVHEVDEGKSAEIQISGLFDVYQWTLEKLRAQKDIKTKESECQPEDQKMLTEKIEARKGGFDRLDHVIAEFRKRMGADLEKQLKKQPVAVDETRHENEFHLFQQDWWYCEHPNNWTRIEWAFHKPWASAMQRMAAEFGTETSITAYPLGAASFPFGQAVRYIDDDETAPPADFIKEENWIILPNRPSRS